MNVQTITLLVAAVSALLTAGIAIVVLRMRVEAASPDQSGDITSRLDKMAVDIASDRGALTEKMTQVDTKIASLQTTVDQREGALQSQVTQLDASMRGIVGLFSNDRQRGSWGELSLERIFEVAGLVEGRDYKNQFAEGEGRPDVVVFLPGDQTIVIDSKFPIARYLDAMAEPDTDKRQAALVAHGKELESVGKSLVKKHYAANASAGYVIVFVPSQAVYEAAAEAHPEVVDRLMAQGVIVAGPVNVFALIKTAGTLMAEHRAVKDAREIVSNVRELRNRIGKFASHLEKVGKGLSSASKAYNSAIGSWNSRVGPWVNRVAEMSGADQLAHFDEVTEAIGVAAPNDLKEAV